MSTLCLAFAHARASRVPPANAAPANAVAARPTPPSRRLPERRVGTAAPLCRRAPRASSSSSSSDALPDVEYASYEDLLDAKASRVRALFGGDDAPPDVPRRLPPSGLEVYPSPKTRGYRLRCRFAVIREGAETDADGDGEGDGTLRYALFERGRVRTLDEDDDDAFRAGSDAVVALMPKLMRRLRDADARKSPLVRGLAAVGFLANRDGDVIVTLWNRTEKENETGKTRTRKTNPPNGGREESEDAGIADADDGWDSAANALVAELGVAGVVRRRKGEVTVASAGTDRVWETIRVPKWGAEEGAEEGTETLRLAQPEGAFSNPNGDVAEATAAWLRETVDLARAERESNPRGDGTRETPFGRLPTLVELYCGNGNHTCALASRFARAVAVEIEPTLVAAARENFRVNGVDNADVRALPAEVFSRDETDKDASEWLANAETEGVILVDPPRAGCDEDTLRLVARFRSVLYIACDATSLVRDLNERGLAETHDVRRAALFDHFPYSQFCEVVVWLEAKETKGEGRGERPRSPGA